MRPITLRDFYERDYIIKSSTLSIENCDYKVAQIWRILNHANVSETRIIVDVGCGSGMVLSKLALLLGAESAIGCDISGKILSRAKELAPTNEYIQADAARLPLRNSSVDLCMAVDLIEHLPNPEESLGELKRVSKDVVVFAPLESGIISDIIYFAMHALRKETNRERYGHIHRFNRKSIILLLKRSRLELNIWSFAEPPPVTYKKLTGKVPYTLSCMADRISRRLHKSLFNGFYFVGFCSDKARSSRENTKLLWKGSLNPQI